VTAFNRSIAKLGAAATALILSSPTGAYETDQFYNRSQPIADSTEVLNRKVNETLIEIAADWRKGNDQKAFVNAVYHKLGGHHWVDKLERWAMKSPDVDKLETPRYDSIYAGLPIWATRTTFLFGIGATIRINDQLIGSDKIGHFFSQGRKYYRRYLKSGSEEKAARQSAFTERAIFGSSTTGSYSNADLVANYEGHRFYRSLFEDDVVPGKAAILRWADDGWLIQRHFDWADHVNEYWDEALNVNRYDDLIYKSMRERMIDLCPQYWENPSLYTIENEEPLKVRYAHLQLHDSWHLRLDALCPANASVEEESALAVGDAPSAGAGTSK
jgi:hypothetical protein